MRSSAAVALATTAISTGLAASTTTMLASGTASTCKQDPAVWVPPLAVRTANSSTVDKTDPQPHIALKVCHQSGAPAIASPCPSTYPFVVSIQEQARRSAPRPEQNPAVLHAPNAGGRLSRVTKRPTSACEWSRGNWFLDLSCRYCANRPTLRATVTSELARRGARPGSNPGKDPKSHAAETS